MKKLISAICAASMAVHLLFSAVPVFAEGEAEAYTEPESPSVTYNMNLDWKFLDALSLGADLKQDIWTVMAKADKDGKKFYEKDYDDTSWETVSIPHGIGGGTKTFGAANFDAGGGYRSVLFYRKTITLPQYEQGGKVIFELDGIRQGAYVWVNGEQVGYYEAGITAMGFDLSNYVKPGEQAVIAILNDGLTSRGTYDRIPYETVPGEKWGSSYSADNYKISVGSGAGYVWNTKDFNEPQIGLVYDAYLHIKGKVYQTLPLYNNLKTTGNYIYADNFDIRSRKATIHVDAEIRNESDADGSYTLEVAVVDAEGNLKYNFESEAATVSKATDAGITYETAVESNVYDPSSLDVIETLPDSELEIINDPSKRPSRNANNIFLTYKENWSEIAAVDSNTNLTGYDERGYIIKYYDRSDSQKKEVPAANAKYYSVLQSVERTTHNEIDLTQVNTVDVTHIKASYTASDIRFWSTDDPYLYTVYTILKDSSGKAVDVQKKETGFRKITYAADSGILINDKAVWMPGYAQRSTNEWAVIGSPTDWLQDYDMSLLKDNNSNFIRWMHVAPKPYEVRSSDRYGVAVVVPAGDKEGVGLDGRNWSQRTEAMRDVMIYFRNSPSVVFYETGNSAVGYSAEADEMANLRDKIDPYGMRFIGARSTTAADQMNYDYNYAGTMYGNYANSAINAMKQNGKMGPIMETEYARDESPRRVWDVYSPPDYDYVNKYLSKGGKNDGYDVWDLTQEEATIANVKEYNGYYANRAGSGSSIYSAAAMMVWSDSNMHTRNTATENCRTTGRVDPVRQTKEMFEGTKAAQSSEAAVHIVGHWSYPAVSDDTYNYFKTEQIAIDGSHSYERFTSEKLRRDPTKKTVYVIGSADIKKVELYRLDGDAETLLGTDETADSNFIYQFDNIDVTKGDAVIAKAYDARGEQVTSDKIERTYDAVSLRLTPHTAVKEDADGNMTTDWRADGSDIAYFDVEVIDKNGNVCALNYDRIKFESSGEGVYLGGYNSGMGSGCFQNSEESRGLSFYFGGNKDGVSTLGKDYVYAENGTNRIFVRSTRKAGAFTLTATMDGMLPVSSTISSEAVETEGGLTRQMPSVLKPGTQAAPVNSDVPVMKPLMFEKKLISWSDANIVTDKDEKVYYDVYINGTKRDFSAKTYVGTMDNIFGPAYEILTAAKDAGATGFDVKMAVSGSVNELVVTSPDGDTYHYPENSNQYYINGNKSDTNECVDTTVISDGVLIANLTQLLGFAGLQYEEDKSGLAIKITIQ